MKNYDYFDNLFADLRDTRNLYFVFAAFGENIIDALHVPLEYPDDVNKSFKIALKRMPKFVADGVYAVFLHPQSEYNYTFYCTCNISRSIKKNDLSCDTE